MKGRKLRKSLKVAMLDADDRLSISQSTIQLIDKEVKNAYSQSDSEKNEILIKWHQDF